MCSLRSAIAVWLISYVVGVGFAPGVLLDLDAKAPSREGQRSYGGGSTARTQRTFRGRVSTLTVTGYDASGEVVEEELAPGTEVQVVATWTSDLSEGVTVTRLDANGGILWNVNGAETVGPWTVWPSMLGCRGVGTYCKLGVGLEDYSRVVA